MQAGNCGPAARACILLLQYSPVVIQRPEAHTEHLRVGSHSKAKPRQVRVPPQERRAALASQQAPPAQPVHSSICRLLLNCPTWKQKKGAMSWSHSSSEKRGMGTSKRLGPHFSSAATSLPSLPYPLLARYAANVSCADAVRWGGKGGARQRRQHPPSIAALPLPDAKAQHHHTPCILHPAPSAPHAARSTRHPAAPGCHPA